MPHNQLFQLVSQQFLLSEQETIWLKEAFVPQQVARNTFLEKEGTIAGHLYFINSGFVRAYMLGKDQVTELTTNIAQAGNLVTAFNSFTQQAFSTENIKTITDTHLLSISNVAYLDLYQKSKMWAAFCKTVYEKHIMSQQKRLEDTLYMSAEERYRKLLETQPQIIQNVPVQDVASYLGIKPESLSRIRRQIS